VWRGVITVWPCALQGAGVALPTHRSKEHLVLPPVIAVLKSEQGQESKASPMDSPAIAMMPLLPVVDLEASDMLY
jgi:hypothetical protein